MGRVETLISTSYSNIEGADNEDIAGEVSIKVSGTDAPVTSVRAGEKTITLTGVVPGEIYYVGILPQSFEKGITLDFFNGASKVGSKTIFNGTAGPTVNRSMVCRAGTVTPEKPEPVFTVNADGTKVRFASCNLYRAGSVFRFETNRWSCQTSWTSNHVSHFYWSKAASVAYASTYSDSGASAGDVFFTNDPDDEKKPNPDFSVYNGDKKETGKWRTLTDGNTGEWYYLLCSRPMPSGKSHYPNGSGGISIDGSTHYGLFIYPDDYSGLEIGHGGPGTWTDINSAGIVFLPRAGFHRGSTFSNTTTAGYYWPSSSYDSSASRASYMRFDQNYVFSYGPTGRNCGFTVRLVTDIH